MTCHAVQFVDFENCFGYPVLELSVAIRLVCLSDAFFTRRTVTLRAHVEVFDARRNPMLLCWSAWGSVVSQFVVPYIDDLL